MRRGMKKLTYVAPRRVDEVASADAVAVAVAPGDQHRQVGVGQLDPRRDRQRPAVDGVEAVRVDEAGQVGGAADPGDDHEIVGREPEPRRRRLDGAQDAEVTAARAPVGLDLALEVLGPQRCRGKRAHLRASSAWRVRGKAAGEASGVSQTRRKPRGLPAFTKASTASATSRGEKGSPSYLRTRPSAARPVSARRWRANWPEALFSTTTVFPARPRIAPTS